MNDYCNIDILFASEFSELINNFILSVDLFNTYNDKAIMMVMVMIMMMVVVVVYFFLLLIEA